MTTTENTLVTVLSDTHGIYLLEMTTTENPVLFDIPSQRYLPAWNDNHRKLNWIVVDGIYLLEMTTTENVAVYCFV